MQPLVKCCQCGDPVSATPLDGRGVVCFLCGFKNLAAAIRAENAASKAARDIKAMIPNDAPREQLPAHELSEPMSLDDALYDALGYYPAVRE